MLLDKKWKKESKPDICMDGNRKTNNNKKGMKKG